MAVTNSLANRQKKTGFTAYLTNEAVKAQITKVVAGKNGDRFITSIISAVNTNPALQECTNQSILSAALLGESLKLSPSPQLGQYYMVPFNDKNKGKVAQFQLGYKGYIQLALRSGQYKKLNVLAIKEGELVRYDPLNEDIEVKLIDDEEEREKAPTIGYYAMFEYLNGFRKTMYWSRNKMLRHQHQVRKEAQGQLRGIRSGQLSTERCMDVLLFLVQGLRRHGLQDNAAPADQQVGHYVDRNGRCHGQGYDRHQRGWHCGLCRDRGSTRCRTCSRH